MGHRVGTKGQVVIAKEIRDRLGIEPGAETVQTIVDGHVELHFIPKRGRKSLRGALAKYVTHPVSDEQLREWRQEAWVEPPGEHDEPN